MAAQTTSQLRASRCHRYIIELPHTNLTRRSSTLQDDVDTCYSSCCADAAHAACGSFAPLASYPAPPPDPRTATASDSSHDEANAGTWKIEDCCMSTADQKHRKRSTAVCEGSLKTRRLATDTTILAHTISQRIRTLKKVPPELIPLGKSTS